MVTRSVPTSPPKEFWEDDKWIDENITELSRQYPNMWIAVVDKRVVASGENLREVIDKARELTGREHIPTHFVEKGVHVY
ncbi:MAG: DUF5678 domain-containing protein [bacterium]